jgi:D-3-phosphoglycerate dehydrogenase
VRILIADKLAPQGAAFLKAQADTEVTVRTGLAGDDLAEALRDHDGMVVRSAVKVTGPVLDHCSRHPGWRLRAIARAGVGVDNIDLDAATRLGVAVMNSASATTITTAEHTFALMIALARNVPWAHATMAGGGWDRSRFVGSQLHGRTLGVVGLGRIGTALAERALAFGMNVRAYDPFINAETALDGRVPLCGSFEELLTDADIVSFHVPKTGESRHMMNADAFARARPGLLVVNASRGGIVDEAALLQALDDGRCAGAALDVYDPEPPPEDSPLRNHPRILTTPHLGASTSEAQEAVAVDACRALVTYLRGDGMIGAVNAGGLSLDLSDRHRAFIDLSTRMIALLEAAVGLKGLKQVRCTARGGSIAGRADTIARYALAELLGRHLH